MSTQSDAVPIPVASVVDTTTPPSFDKFDVGIFNHPDDHNIIERLKPIIENLGYSVCTHEEYSCEGSERQTKCVNFIKECHCVFWLATSNSLKEGYTKFSRTIAQHRSIKSGEVNTFITVLPKNSLALKLPLELDAYEPLKEDENFQRSVKATVDRILRKLRPSTELPNLTSSATTVTSSDLQSTNDNQNSIGQAASGSSTIYNITIQDSKIGNLSVVAGQIQQTTQYSQMHVAPSTKEVYENTDQQDLAVSPEIELSSSSDAKQHNMSALSSLDEISRESGDGAEDDMEKDVNVPKWN